MTALKLGLITAVLFVIAVVNDWSTPDRLIVTLAIALLLAWIWSRFSLQRMGFTRTLSMDRLRVGEVIHEELSLINHSLLPRLWVEVRDLSSLPGHTAGNIVNLPSRGASTWQATTTCVRRGRFRLGPIVLTSSDPLGLFERHVAIPATHELIVYPASVDISRVPLPLATMSGGRETAGRSALVSHTVAGIREYHVGDPLNRIAWSAAARLGRMMVKEFDPEPSSDIWVLLDLSELEGSNSANVSGARLDEQVEYAIAIAGSIAEASLAEGRRVGMILNRAMPILIDADGSQRQWFRIFETLAVASQFGQRSLHDAIVDDSRRFTRNAGLIVVTASPSADWIDAARSLVQRQVPVTAVLVADHDQQAGADLALLAAQLADARVSSVQLSPAGNILGEQRSAGARLA